MLIYVLIILGISLLKFETNFTQSHKSIRTPFHFKHVNTVCGCISGSCRLGKSKSNFTPSHRVKLMPFFFAPARSDNIPKCLANHSVSTADQTFKFCSGHLRATLYPRQKIIIVKIIIKIRFTQN